MKEKSFKNSASYTGRFIALGTAFWLGAAGIAGAQGADPRPGQDPAHPAHDELRALRKEIVAAITAGDVDETLKYIAENAVVTWQNNEVCRGREGLRAFLERMGRDAFKSYRVEPTPDELTILYGDDLGVSFGRTVGLYRVLGKEFEFDNRWTATLVKEGGQWKLASYQVGLNALDNPVLGAAKGAFGWMGGLAAAALVAGLLTGRVLGIRAAKSGGGKP